MMTNPPLSSDQILARLKEQGASQARIAQRLNLPSSAVSNLYSGKRQLKFSEAQVLLAMLENKEPGLNLPLIGMAGAGNWVEAVEDSRETIHIPAELEPRGRFAVEVCGNSMNLILPEGSYAAVDPDDTRLFSGKIYLLINSEGEATIKRYRTEPSRFEPVSDDSSYSPFEVGSADFRVIGRVTTALQKL